jgi:hypothetical protein
MNQQAWKSCGHCAASNQKTLLRDDNFAALALSPSELARCRIASVEFAPDRIYLARAMTLAPRGAAKRKDHLPFEKCFCACQNKVLATMAVV